MADETDQWEPDSVEVAKDLFAAAVMHLAASEDPLPQRLEHAYRFHAAQVLPFLHELPRVIAEKIHELERGIREAVSPGHQAEQICQVAYELLLVSLLGMGE